jgi:hypothetical protein
MGSMGSYIERVILNLKILIFGLKNLIIGRLDKSPTVMVF